MIDTIAITSQASNAQKSAGNIWDVMVTVLSTFVMKNDAWAVILVCLIITIPIIMFFLLKFKILTPIIVRRWFTPKPQSERRRNLSDIDKENISLKSAQTILMSELAESKDKIKKAADMRYQSDMAIADIKAIYLAEIHQQTETMITKSLTELENWFNKTAIDCEPSDASQACRMCRKKSFRSASDNILSILKEEVAIALEKNGFLTLEGKDFDKYVSDKWFVFLKIIKDSLTNYYIFTDEMDRDHVEKERAYKNIENTVYDMLTYLKEKESKMVLKIAELKKDFDVEFEKLIK